MADKDNTSIQIKKSTKDRLAKLGSKADSYDAIVSRLMDEYEKRRDRRDN